MKFSGFVLGCDILSQARQRMEKTGRRMRGAGGKEEGRRNRTLTGILRRFSPSADPGVEFRGFRLGSRDEVRVPGNPVEKRQQLSHRRDHRPLVGMPLRARPAVVRAKDGVPHDGRDAGHVERVPDVLASAPDPPLPFLCSALPLLGSDADKPVQLPVGERPDLLNPRNSTPGSAEGEKRRRIPVTGCGFSSLPPSPLHPSSFFLSDRKSVV